MPRRRQINADPGARRLRSTLVAATEPIRSAAWAIERRIVWRGADFLRGIAEVAKWPLERLTWLTEKRLIWPLQERTAGSSHAIRAVALVAVAALAVTFGVISLSDNGSAPEQVATPAPVVALTSPSPTSTKAQPVEPALQGAPPSFAVGEGVGVAKAPDDAISSDAGTDVDAPAATVPDEEAAAATSSQEPVPAGPAAMKVARRFAEAFVFYEIGERPERTEAVFGETTTPQLATALEERPPRQPEGVEVPQARVLNLVPGPRRGKTFTVSASLLRVGATSELRLEIEKQNGSWVITDVRG